MPQYNSSPSTSVKVHSDVNSNSQKDDSFYNFTNEIRRATTCFAPTKDEERIQSNLQVCCLERVILLAGVAQHKMDYLEPIMLPGLCAQQKHTTLFVLRRAYSADWVNPFLSRLNRSIPKSNARVIIPDDFVNNYSSIIINSYFSYLSFDHARVQGDRAVRGTLNASTIIAVDTKALSNRVLPILTQQMRRYPKLSVTKIFSGIKLPLFTAASTLRTVNTTFLGDVLFNLLQDNAKQANELSTVLANVFIPYDLLTIICEYLSFTLYSNETIQLMKQPKPYTHESYHHLTFVENTELVSIPPCAPTLPPANPFFKMLFNYFNLLQPGFCFFSTNQVIFEAVLLLNDTLLLDLESTLVAHSELRTKHLEINFLMPQISRLKSVYAADCLAASLSDSLFDAKNALKLSIANLIDHLQVNGLTRSSDWSGLIADIKRTKVALLKHYPQTSGLGILSRTPVSIYSHIYTTSRELDDILMTLESPSLLEDFRKSMGITSMSNATAATGAPVASGKRHLRDASETTSSKRLKPSLLSAANGHSFWDSSSACVGNDATPKPQMIYKTI